VTMIFVLDHSQCSLAPLGANINNLSLPYSSSQHTDVSLYLEYVAGSLDSLLSGDGNLDVLLSEVHISSESGVRLPLGRSARSSLLQHLIDL
jgi:hypothetical protein